jgi:uncharacterized protein (TIGR00255 family)
MAYSMTGFGSAKSHIDGTDVEVQVKTLNHRGLDIHINMPKMPGQMELLFQRLIRQFVGRGRVDLTVIIGDEKKARAGLNSALLEARVAALNSIFGDAWSRNKCLEFCLAQRDVWEFEQSPTMSDSFYEGVLETARDALEVLSRARRVEGKSLEAYMLNALDEIDTSRQAALERAPERLTEYREQLIERLNALKSEPRIVVDAQRVAMEVALLADKIDITEELTRIATHLSALRILVHTPADPLSCIGKKIDFYLQELNREATTMASKSRDTILTRHTIDIRTKLESIREQAANIQ